MKRVYTYTATYRGLSAVEQAKILVAAAQVVPDSDAVVSRDPLVQLVLLKFKQEADLTRLERLLSTWGTARVAGILRDAQNGIETILAEEVLEAAEADKRRLESAGAVAEIRAVEDTQ